MIGLYFKPQLAKILAPVYALAQGFFLGAISKGYETYHDGIVVQAAGATIAVFAVMLVLYRTRIIKVTDRFRRIVIGATVGIMVFYGVCLLIRLVRRRRLDQLPRPARACSASGSACFVAGLAAMNLALDFDFIERGRAAGVCRRTSSGTRPSALLVTVVWLYLELLRLLAKLRDR